MREARRRVRVMQSFGAPRATTNPYITMLDAVLTASPGIEHSTFSWPQAIFGRYDVFHWHWPEGKLNGTTWWKSAGKIALTALLSARHALSRRIAVVRTVHNIELPDVDATRTALLKRIDRQTTLRIMLNETTAVPLGAPSALILHGHYRDWYDRYPHATKVPGRIGTFGGVRRYKSVDALVDAYAAAVAVDPTLSLRVGGKASTPQLAADLRARASELPGVELNLTFLSDAELVELATSSELIVLAYRFMHNSGSVLASLSLDRPVLVPRNETNVALANEVGPDWVLMYDGELDEADLLAARSSASTIREGERPDLSRREWDTAGAAHADAYRVALRAKRGGGDPPLRQTDSETE